MPIKSTIAKLKKHCLVASALSVKPEWGADTYRVYAQKYHISPQDVEDYACFVTGIAKTAVFVYLLHFLLVYCFQKKKRLSDKLWNTLKI